MTPPLMLDVMRQQLVLIEVTIPDLVTIGASEALIARLQLLHAEGLHLVEQSAPLAEMQSFAERLQTAAEAVIMFCARLTHGMNELQRELMRALLNYGELRVAGADGEQIAHAKGEVKRAFDQARTHLSPTQMANVTLRILNASLSLGLGDGGMSR